MIKINDMIQGKIERLAFGGKGILRTPEGMVVFIPFTAPQDFVECKITHVKKNYAEGEILRLLSPSAARDTPLCPYFGTCGGCQLQHLKYLSQLDYKKNTVQDALRKLYHAEIGVTAADPIWEYRRHITLTLQPHAKGFSTGYIGIDNHALIQVKKCPIFSCDSNLFELIAEASALLDSSETGFGKLKVIKTNENGYILSFHFDRLPKNFNDLKGYAGVKGIQGILGTARGNSILFGDPFFTIQVNGEEFKTHPLAFLQNHAQQSQNIYSEIQRAVEPLRPKKILDLYCGMGISSILAAPYAEHVDGVEWNKQSIELGKWNSKKKGISNIHFQASDVLKALDKLLDKEHEFAILNPPRVGLEREVALKLGSSKLQEMIYISCQPATLARDLTLLHPFGFALKKVHVFDMFPQTGHVETLAFISRLSF